MDERKERETQCRPTNEYRTRQGRGTDAGSVRDDGMGAILL